MSFESYARKPPCDRHPQTDDDRRYLKALGGDQHRFGLQMPVLTNEDWGGSYHYGEDRYPDPDEYGEVRGEYLSLTVYEREPNGSWPRHWRVCVWGNDDWYVSKTFFSESAVEAALRRIPTVVEEAALRAQGYRYE